MAKISSTLDVVQTFKLAKPWDLMTSQFINVYDWSGDTSDPDEGYSLAFSPQGHKMYIMNDFLDNY